MEILAFTDAHRNTRVLEEIVRARADIFICLGDLASFGRGLEEAAAVLAPLGERLYLLPGNNETVEQVERVCSEFGFTPLHGRHYELGDLTVAGVGLSPPTPFNTPGEVPDEELGKVLEGFRGLEGLILASHTPPAGTPLEETALGARAGSVSLRRFVDEEGPTLVLCGHVHERAGVEVSLGRTRVVNPGPRGRLFRL